MLCGLISVFEIQRGEVRQGEAASERHKARLLSSVSFTAGGRLGRPLHPTLTHLWHRTPAGSSQKCSEKTHITGRGVGGRERESRKQKHRGQTDRHCGAETEVSGWEQVSQAPKSSLLTLGYGARCNLLLFHRAGARCCFERQSSQKMNTFVILSPCHITSYPIT